MPTVQLRYKSDDAVAIAQEVRKAVAAVAGTPPCCSSTTTGGKPLPPGRCAPGAGRPGRTHPEELQTLRDSGLRLGVSTHGYAEMVRAMRWGPSYIAMGAVSHDAEKWRRHRKGWAAGGLCQTHEELPLVAIGGIGQEQFAEVLATGSAHRGSARLVNADQPEEAAASPMAAMRG